MEEIQIESSKGTSKIIQQKNGRRYYRYKEKTKEKEKKEERKFRRKVLDLVILYSLICAGEIPPQVTKGRNRKNRNSKLVPCKHEDAKEKSTT